VIQREEYCTGGMTEKMGKWELWWCSKEGGVVGNVGGSWLKEGSSECMRDT